jgi:post-segregation antitoxin (ccd killing protein)
VPRTQVYLPDELYNLVKKRRLPASELLHAAVRAEDRRRQLPTAGDKYVAELIAEVGKPTARQRAAAVAVVKERVAKPRRK